MSRIDEIRNRTLSKNSQNKIAALADMVEEKEIPEVNTSDDDTEYIGAIVSVYYKHFLKLDKKNAATLALSACILKANAAIALAIKEKNYA